MSLYVDELFNELSQLPPEEQEKALVMRCAGDPATEAQVRALLSAEAAMTQPIPIQPGTELGAFRLERMLGEGATASVWQAWDTHLRAYTALKLLHPHTVRGDRALRVVLHEARAASSIISDHVVRIKTAGRFPSGPPFIEMELCAEYEPTDDGSEALTIGRSLSEAALHSVAEKVRVVAEAARGVEAAHRIGVLHRDLKPGNILLTPVSRRAKVTDFGLAADQVYPAPAEGTGADRTVTVNTEIPGEGAIVGTPAYMPPEQARGEVPTRATDVYALGATLYALLVGDHPYLADPDAKIPAMDVLGQVKRGPPAPLRTRVRVPLRLVRIVDRAMARAPRCRYATAADFAADLEAWLDGFATQVDGRAPVLRVGLFVARHRTAVLTIGLLVVALLVFGAAVGFLEQRRRTLTAAIDHAQVTMAGYEKRVVRFEADMTKAAEQLAETEADLEDAEAAHRQALLSESAAERRYRMELGQRRAAEEQAQSLQEAMAVTETERDQALADLAVLASDLEVLRAEEAMLQSDVATLTAQLAVSSDRVAALEGDLRAVVSTRDEALARLAETEAALADAETRFGALRNLLSPLPDPAPADPARPVPIEAPEVPAPSPHAAEVDGGAEEAVLPPPGAVDESEIPEVVP